MDVLEAMSTEFLTGVKGRDLFLKSAILIVHQKETVVMTT
jgi:hypothetical protein